MATVPDLLAPVADVSTPPSQPSVLADAIQQTKDRQREDFVSTLETVGTVNPDTFAKATAVSRLSGVPAEVLHQHSSEMERLLKGNKYAALYDTNRRTAAALSNGQVAAMAQDDIDNLARIETAEQITKFENQSVGEKLWGALKQSFVGSRQAGNLSYADTLQRQSKQFDTIDAEIARAEAAGEQPFASGNRPNGFGFTYLEATPEGRAQMRKDLLESQTGAVTSLTDDQATLDAAPVEPGALRYQELGGDTQAMADAIAQNPGFAARSAIGSIVGSAEMLLGGALGGIPLAAVAEFNSESNAKVIDVLREAKIDLSNPKAVLSALQNDELMTDARQRARMKALGTTAVDMIGMGVAGRLLVPKSLAGKPLTAIQREGANLAVQAPVQAVIGGASEAAGQYAADQKISGGDVLMEAVAGLGMSSFEVAAFSGGRIIDSVGEGLAQSRQARQGKAALSEMADAAVSSKLRGRDAETFNTVATNQLKDTSMEMMSIPAEALSKLNQDGDDPILADLLKQIPGLTEQFAEAEARGGSVMMKTADYLTTFADHHEALADSIRTNVEGMSVEESQQWQEAQAQQIDDLVTMVDREPDDRDQTFASMMADLQSAGYRRADAEQYAALHLSAMTTLAARTGKSVSELTERFPLTVRNKAPEAVVKVPATEMQAAIESIRAGDPVTPVATQLKGYLDDLGVDINEMTDEQVMGVLRDPEVIQGTQLNQTGSEKEPRGYITFSAAKPGKARNFQITVTGRRDLSTLLHEFGHFYLEVVADLASDADAPQQIKDDVAAIRSWTGAKETGDFEVDQHEQFARGFESYLSDGKAPNPELAGAFARFKRWIISIYKDLRRLNVELSPEIRGVMDRIVATDDQIRAAEQVTQAIPMFESAEKAGMTEREFQDYRNQVELAHAEAVESVEQQVIREEELRRGKWWREESERVSQEVADELDTLPEYQAIRAFRKGIMPDGSQQEIKLNSAQIQEQYGTAVLRKLAFMHSKSGVESDIAAQMLGFNSGDEMIKAMLGAPPRGEAIKAETATRMMERHGAKATGASTEKAMAAVHNEKRGAVLLKELNALGKQGNRNKITSQQVLKLAAQRIMQERKVRDIQPFEYQRAEGMAGRRAFEAAAKGDLPAAYEAKQQQLLNFHLWREARKARDEIDSIVTRMAGFNKSTKREKLGKAGHDYLDQIDAIMEQYEFRTVSLRDLDKRVSFAKWYADQLAAGNEPDVPEFVLNNSQKVNYKDLSLAQLSELDDFAQNVNHLAGLKNKLLANSRLRDFEQAKNELVRAAYENLKKKDKPPIDKGTLTALEKMGDWAGNMSAALLKMEQIVEWLDNGDIEGPWHTAFWQPFVEAQIAQDDLNREFTNQLMGNVDTYVKARGEKAMREQIHIPEIGESLTRNAILSAALNTGNAGNRKKLLTGYAWTENQLSAILSNMNKDDWDFVQAQWDLVERLWPQIEQLEKDLHGVAPEKIVATPIDTQYGQYSGGYWPLVYDTSAPEYAQVASNLTDNTGLFEQGYAKATTPKGHTKARVDSFAAPIMLDTGIVASHLGQVIHDLTHRKAIIDAAKIISNREIKQALNETLGVNIANQFNPWLQGVANDMVMDSQKGIDAWTNAMATLRANLSVAWMGFSATTGIQQILGFSQSWEHLAQVGARKYLPQGMLEFVTNPFKTIEFVKSLSGEMRNRDANLDNNMRDVLKRISGKTSPKAIIQRLAFKHISVIQSIVDYPTWLAGYHKGMAEGETLATSIALGDRAVRLSQMAAGPKDLAAVQRKDGLMRALTIVYSYFNLLYNRQADLAHSMRTAQGVKDYLNAFERTMFLIVIPAVVAPLMTGGGPEDDDSWSKWAALKIATYPLMSIPLLRDVGSSLESGWAYSGATPIGDVFKSTTRLAAAVGQDELDAERVTMSTLDVVGMGFGLPTAQPKRTLKYLFSVERGERQDDNMIQFMRGLMFGPPKETK